MSKRRSDPWKERVVATAYWPIVRRYWWVFLIMCVLMTVTVFTKYAEPFLLGWLVDDLVANKDVSDDLRNFVILFTIHIGVWLLYDPAITFFETWCMRDADRKTLHVLLNQSARFFESTPTGTQITSSKRFKHTLEFVSDQWAFQFGRILVMLAITLVVFFLKNPALGWAFLGWIAVFFTANYLMARIRMPWDEQAAEAESAVGGALADTISNNQTVRSFAREREEEARFRAVTQEATSKLQWAWIIGGTINRGQGALVAVLQVGALWMLVREWQAQRLTTGDFFFYEMYVLLVIHQLWEVAGALNKFFRHVADAVEMAEIHLSEPDVKDAYGAYPLCIKHGEVEFHAVDFRYGDDGSLAVKKFSLRIAPGETVAIVGKSGAGKSTLMKLIQRFYDPTFGYIAIDGHDISHVTQRSLREQVCLVPQDTTLFHRSLRDNIVIGKPNAADDEIEEAAKRALAWKFICDKPAGLDTKVGERGVKLSGGERQRIAIARAFLADRPILLLDEATSAMDSITEREIQEAIAELLKGRTSIVIAHRLSTIRRADRIVVMDEGTIAAVGTHAELLESCELYATLWKHQVGGYIGTK